MKILFQRKEAQMKTWNIWNNGWQKTQMMDIAWMLQIKFKMVFNCMRILFFWRRG